MGLNNDEFSFIRSQLLAQDSLSQLNKNFNIVMQEENHRKVMVQGDNNNENEATFSMSLPLSM